MKIIPEKAVARSGKPLPAGWRWVRLGDVCEFNPRRPELKRADNAPTTFVPMSAVEGNGQGIQRAEVRPFREVRKGYTYFGEGEVLFAKITPCMQNGKHAIARDLTDGIGFGSTEFHVFRPGKEITSEWIHRFVIQPAVLQGAIAHFSGAVGQQRVPEAYLANLSISLPPLGEQKRIAAILTRQMGAVEKARVATEAQLEAAQALRLAYLREIFFQAGQRLPAGWQRARIGNISEVGTGGTPATGYSEYYGGKVRWLKSGDVKGMYISEVPNRITELGINNSNARVHPVGSVMLAMSGQGKTRGTSAILKLPSACSQSVAAILPSKYAIPEILYFALVLQYDNIRRITGDHERTGLNLKIIRNIEIPLPPLSEQKRIVAILTKQMDAAEKLAENLRAQLETINKIPAALLRKAFQGEL